MSKENLEKFTEMYLDSPELQETLKSTSDKESFVKLMVVLGEESGCSFTTQEVEEKILVGSGTPSRELVSVGEAIDRVEKQGYSKQPNW